jgi:prepilin-type N-terminal cleavage/methylation domain-containing protein
MRLSRQTPRQRPGFTLVEILVVIAIIAVLISLVSAAVIRLLSRGPQLSTQNDIAQLAIGVQNFKNVYKVFPPSKLLLSNNSNDYALATPDDGYNQLRQDSLNFFYKLAPQFDWTSGIDWSGGNPTFLANGKAIILEGDQCLVFCLGGIPTADASNVTGFSTNSRNPTALGGDRKGPFFTFQGGNRLFLRGTDVAGNGNSAFPSYTDAYDLGQPYVYFSSYNKDNGYNRYANLGSDCASLGIAPYFQSAGPPVIYYNRATFQIVSAGADAQFGPGGFRDPGGASVAGDTNGASNDNLANFNEGALLGAP